MTAHSPELSSDRLAQLPVIRTLVLDDSSFDRKRIRRIGDGLDLKLRFEEASSVKALHDCLDRQTFDLFLIDYMMPEADGLAALEVIRNHKGQSDAVSVMISGQADQRVAVNAIKGGCQDFILKSDISPEFLRGTLLSALSTSRQFSRYFDHPKPVLNLDEVRSFMQIALEDGHIREILHDTLQEGLRDAARGVGVAYGLPQGSDLMQFLIDFHRTDDFEFR
jgi:PleD family two-component response regulator